MIGKKIAKGHRSHLYDRDGNRYLDLCMGYGSVSLGHGYEVVQKGIVDQLGKFSSPGFLQVDVFDEAKNIIEKFLPGEYELHGFYPAGALAIETCIKSSMFLTGKKNIVSFKGSMHGKSMSTIGLGTKVDYLYDNNDYRLPNYTEISEFEVIDNFERKVKAGDCAAVIIEPVLMSAGGVRASNIFYNAIAEIAKENNLLLIYDEVLTGCYRMGPRFMYDSNDLAPDFVVAGKAIANGFPVAVVMHGRDIEMTRDMLIGGTYYNHPLMSRAVCETISEFERLNVSESVRAIDVAIKKWEGQIPLYGSGAAWTIPFRNKSTCSKAIEKLEKERIIVSYYDKNIRLLPNYLIDVEELDRTMSVLSKCM